MNVTAVQPKAVSFRDDTNFYTHYHVKDAMSDLSEKGYKIDGDNNTDAFGKLYHDVNNQLKTIAEAPSSMWGDEYVHGHPRYEDGSVYVLVERMEYDRNFFAGLLDRFWARNKDVKPEKLSEAIDPFLELHENTPVPSFWQRIRSWLWAGDFKEYFKKEAILSDVVDVFLKEGKHNLKR